jgi:hypothetical protein
VGISPRAVLGGGHVQKMTHNGEASASSYGDSANSLHGSFGSGLSSYGSSKTQMSSFYSCFGARKLETIWRWLRLDGEQRLGFRVRERVTGRGLYRGKPLTYR